MTDGRRPRFVVMGELYMTDDSILVQGYNDKWRKQRKILHQALVPRAIQKYKPIQDAESKRLLWDLIQTPQNFETHLNRYALARKNIVQHDFNGRYAASVVMCIAYGRRIDSMDAKVLHNVDSAMEFIGSLNVPGAYLAETLPFLARLPTFLAPWKGIVQKRGIEDANLFGNLGMEVKERGDAGKSVPDCFVKSVIEVRPSHCCPGAAMTGSHLDTQS